MLPITLSSYMATPAGIEPATSGVTGRRDNHLRHGAIMVPSMGLEPIRDCSHQPLKLACLPFHHNGIGDASGLEPGNSTLKGWRLYQFVQRTKLFVPRNQLVQIIRRICGGNLFKTTSNNLPKRMLFLLSVLTDLKFHTTLCCTVNPKSIFSYWNLSNNFLFTGLIFCQCFPWHSNSPLVMPVGIEPTTSSLRGW